MLAAGGLLAAVTVAAGSGPAALAATAGPSCASGVCSVTFATPGIGQSFTVPAGVPSLSLTLYGAVGGENDTSDVAGGDGAKLTADLALSPGDGINSTSAKPAAPPPFLTPMPWAVSTAAGIRMAAAGAAAPPT